MPGFGDELKRFAPHAVILVMFLLGIFIIYSGSALINPARAQVDLGRVGEVVTDTVSGAAAERAGEIAEAELELESPAEVIEEVPEEELPPPESIEVEPEEQEITEEQERAIIAQYHTSSEGIGGKKFRDLNDFELRQNLDDIITMIFGASNEAAVSGLLPIFQRFQVMVSSPYEQIDDWNQPPWDSGARRYSPFDPPGIAGAPPIGIRPVPPFPNPLGVGVVRGPELTPTARQIAQLTVLKGVMGEPGSYFAILIPPDGRAEIRVTEGDSIATWPVGDTPANYIITEITLSGVKIINENKPAEVGLVHFRARTGMPEISISY